MPNINSQSESRVIAAYSVQYAHSNNIIEPVVLRISCLNQDSKMQSATYASQSEQQHQYHEELTRHPRPTSL